MATFGTKSMGGDSADVTMAPGGGDGASAQGSGHDNGGAVVDVTDTAWKDGLRAGDLVDAQDASGVWYQVRGLPCVIQAVGKLAPISQHVLLTRVLFLHRTFVLFRPVSWR